MNKKIVIFTLIALAFLVSISCAQTSSSTHTQGDLSSAPYKNSLLSVVDRTQDLLARMTLDEKIGQMTQVAKDFLGSDSTIAEYFLGSVLSGGGMGPAVNTPDAWADMYDEYQSYALATRLAIPIIYGIDAVHGNNAMKGAVVFPHNIGMGCTRDPALVEKACAITALEVAATGIDWTFSPCIAVPRDERWGRTYEGFGETPDLQEMMAQAEVLGYQGKQLGEPGKILACAKHYLGDGGTKNGMDRGDTICDEETLRKIFLPGYIKAIDAGAGSVMASFSSWNGIKMHGNKNLLTDVLKTELGFAGFVVSDWMAINQLPGSYQAQIAASINAGIDMVMVPDNYSDFYFSLRKAIENKDIPMDRIDDAVRRILRIKFALGVFEKPYADRSLIPLVGSAEHRQVARECVRESAVLLKNEKNILPLKKTAKRIHVAGKIADDIGSMCGGWTITWQGETGSITDGTTILQGIKDSVSAATSVTYSQDGTGAAGAEVGIAVVGETPYAEGMGDSNDLVLSASDLDAIKNMKDANIPVAVVLVSGRPLVITDELPKWNALLAVWLPGTEGEGIADVIFGDYNPTGKLSHTWPKSMKQIPVNYGDPVYDPLFPYGFGLGYAIR